MLAHCTVENCLPHTVVPGAMESRSAVASLQDCMQPPLDVHSPLLEHFSPSKAPHLNSGLLKP